MIRYSLQCADGHLFDEWFDSMADYDHQAEAHRLTCPDCGSHDVAKAIVAPNIGRRSAEPAPACAAQSGHSHGPGCGHCQFADS